MYSIFFPLCHISNEIIFLIKNYFVISNNFSNFSDQLEQFFFVLRSQFFFFLVFFPLIALVIIFFLSFSNNFFQKKIHNIALIFSLLLFLASLSLIFSLKKNFFYFQTIIYFTTSPLIDHTWFVFGLDYISLSLIILTNFFIFLCILSIQFAEIRGKYKSSALIIKLFFIQWGLTCAFSALDLIGFYIFFEATLIPIFMIILQGGSRERRSRASYLIAIYTLFGSIFMLFNILYFFAKYGTTNYLILFSTSISLLDQKWLWISFFLAFAVKIPVFPFHIWLPEAHVEAPTIGSVILAALLLKLGIYGLLRFNLSLLPYGQEYWKHFISILTICSFFYTNLTAIRQVDIKKIIAYSSVVHMNLIVLGLLCVSVESLDGSIYQMLAHGIVSGALFFCIGIIYERFKSRFLWYYGGVAFVLPIFSIFFFIFILANISFPLTSNFIGEMLLFIGIFKDNFTLGILASLSMFWGVIYNIWTYNRICFGNIKFNYTTFASTYNQATNSSIKTLDINLRKITWNPSYTFFDESFLNKNTFINSIFYSWMEFWINLKTFFKYTHSQLQNILKKKYSQSKYSLDLEHTDFYILFILLIALLLTGISSSIILDLITLNNTFLYEHYILNFFYKN